MYLSNLIFDYRIPKARWLLIRPYLLHKAIFRAFPDITDGGPGRVLYRLDEDDVSGNTYLLIQSEKEPRWKNAGMLTECLVCPPEYKPFTPAFREGQVLYFRLRANPTVKRNGKRLGILEEEVQLAWLKRKAATSGFSILSCSIIPEGIIKDSKHEAEGEKLDMSLFSVRFEGMLRVEDTEVFLKAIQNGIGSGKGLGFGLLSIAVARN